MLIWCLSGGTVCLVTYAKHRPDRVQNYRLPAYSQNDLWIRYTLPAECVRLTKWIKSISTCTMSPNICYHEMSGLLPQPTLTLEKDGTSQERPSRPFRHPKKKQRAPAEPELSESDEYVDFTEPRHEPMAEFNAVIVGDETETSSAVQSIQQVRMKIYTKVSALLLQ